ncbi:MAG TPA: sigma-70 family RNA polymerase sigma factor [Solirubrobacteraceae bacterium]|nr:sigma-70 family RNA polymerase sigma factor [Solirubrobacteraceae bacterium]
MPRRRSSSREPARAPSTGPDITQREEFERLIAAQRPLMLAYLRSILRHDEDAEDVLQRCVTEAWLRAEAFDPERGSARSWLLSICRSRALDHLRRRWPEPRDPADMEALAGAAQEDSRDELERWRIADALRRLPAREAELLRLRFGEGLSQREISERTGIPLGTVKTRMVRGLRALRRLLEEDPGGGDAMGRDGSEHERR